MKVDTSGTSSHINISWLAIVHLPDGRRFVTDACLLLDMEYVIAGPIPIETAPAQKVEHLLGWNTTHEFDLAELRTTGPSGHYWAPRRILLNRKYVEYLRRISVREHLYFRASVPYDPVLIFDGNNIIGALMPMLAKENSPEVN